MDVASLIRSARNRSGLSLRALAERAGTSHSALAAYESSSKSPNAATLDRVLTAAGYSVDVTLSPRVRFADGIARGDELAAVLDLAEAFPTRHSPELDFPVFGMANTQS